MMLQIIVILLLYDENVEMSSSVVLRSTGLDVIFVTKSITFNLYCFFKYPGMFFNNFSIWNFSFLQKLVKPREILKNIKQNVAFCICQWSQVMYQQYNVTFYINYVCRLLKTNGWRCWTFHNAVISENSLVVMLMKLFLSFHFIVNVPMIAATAYQVPSLHKKKCELILISMSPFCLPFWHTFNTISKRSSDQNLSAKFLNERLNFCITPNQQRKHEKCSWAKMCFFYFYLCCSWNKL